MLKYSEALRNAMQVTDCLRNLLTGTELRIYDGPVPSSPTDSIGSATLLVVIKKDGSTGVSFEPAASGGTLTKSAAEIWTGNAIATGTATFFRMVTPSDDDSLSLSNYRIQGNVAIAGGDMNISNLSIASGAPQAISYFYLTIPES